MYSIYVSQCVVRQNYKKIGLRQLYQCHCKQVIQVMYTDGDKRESGPEVRGPT